MKRKNCRYTLYILFGITVLFGIFACSDPSDLTEQWIGNGEIVYPGKSDSIAIYPGRHRVVITIARPVDPHVERIGIFWHFGDDSLMVDFPTNRDTIRVEIDSLKKEGSYVFNIYTYDGRGNRSVGQTVTATVYGSIYANSLINRQVEFGYKPGTGLVLDLGPGLPSMLGVKVKYTNQSNKIDSAYIPIDTSRFILSNFKISSKIKYQTLYKPDSMAIDTFSAGTKIAKVNNIILINAQYPIMNNKAIGTFAGGKFGTPAHWIVNDEARVFPGNKGMDTGGTRNTDHQLGISTFPAVSSLPVNGKIYQTLTLPAGSYYLKIDYGNCRKNYPFYATVAKGNTIPNVDDVKSESLGYALNGFQVVRHIEFKLTNKTKISYGFVFTIPEHQSSFYVQNVHLYYSADLNTTFPKRQSNLPPPSPCPGP